MAVVWPSRLTNVAVVIVVKLLIVAAATAAAGADTSSRSKTEMNNTIDDGDAATSIWNYVDSLDDNGNTGDTAAAAEAAASALAAVPGLPISAYTDDDEGFPPSAASLDAADGAVLSLLNQSQLDQLRLQFDESSVNAYRYERIIYACAYGAIIVISFFGNLLVCKVCLRPAVQQ